MPDSPPEGPLATEEEAMRLIEGLDQLDLGRCVVAGECVRFDETARNSLKDFRSRVAGGLSAASHHPSNFLLWGAPGSGKSYLVQQIASSVSGEVRFVEANLAQLDFEGLRAQLADAEAGTKDVVCLVDEVDAQPNDPWPFELLLPALEPLRPPAHHIVYCLAGSGGADLDEFKQRIQRRSKGHDLLSRIPVGNEFEVPALRSGDKMLVAASQLVAAGKAEGRPVREIEKFALFYLATNPSLSSARQLRALAFDGARRIPTGEDRLRYDNLFEPGDAKNKRFWYDHEAAREGLSGVFLPIAWSGTGAAVLPPSTERSPTPVGAPPPLQRIAILPFLNISPQPSDTYFSDGLTEELIATVSRIGGLGVIARTSVMRYRDGAKSAAEAARELRVGTLLEGSVRRAGDDLRVTAQLIDVQSEQPMWSMTFDRRLENVFAIQQELAERIAESLHVRLLGGERANLAAPPTRSRAAHDLYLQGRYRFYEVTKDGFAAAIGLFEQAIAIDPKFALAYSALAEAHALSGNRGFVPMGPALERAERYARTALELDPNLAEAHAALAPILYNRYDWRGALGKLDRAVALDPNNVQARFWRAVAVGTVGQPADGLADAQKAVELDPLNPRRYVVLGQQYYWLRRYDLALGVLRLPIVGMSADGPWIVAHSLLFSGQRQEAIDFARARANGPGGQSLEPRVVLASVLANAGQAAEAREILAGLIEQTGTPEVPAGAVGSIYAALGEYDMAVDWFTRAHAEGSIFGVCDLAIDPLFEGLRSAPRFEELRRLFGLG